MNSLRPMVIAACVVLLSIGCSTADKPTQDAPAEDVHHQPGFERMDGMLSDEQMAELSQKTFAIVDFLRYRFY